MDLSNFFSSLDITVKATSLGIVVLAAIAWFWWNPKIRRTAIELDVLRRHFQEFQPIGLDAIKQAVQHTNNINIRAILAETQSGLFELPGDLGAKTYSLRFYRDIWTPKSLLAQKVNLALFEAAPNILIGIGLLCTFFFLAIALADVMPALSTNATQEGIRSAISGLLQNAAGKFLTSISGMFCSLVWTFASKSSLENLDDEIEALCSAMRKHVEDTGSEAAISAQTILLIELLAESREQVGQLKRFETDFAVAIGKALGSQMQPAFEQLASSISIALNALTEKVGSMNEKALSRMLADFKSAIAEHSGKEMESFKQTLVEIAGQIKDAANRLEGAGGQASEAIRAGGKEFVDSLSGGAANLLNAATILEQAIVTAKATVNDIDETLERASSSGRQGLTDLDNVLGQLTRTTSQVFELIERAQAAGVEFKSAASESAVAANNLRQAVSENGAIVGTLSDITKTIEGSLTTANGEFKSTVNRPGFGGGSNP